MLELLHVALEKVGRILSPGPLLEGWVRNAGFVNVNHLLMRLPVGTWPKDKRLVSSVSNQSLSTPFTGRGISISSKIFEDGWFPG